MPPQTVQDQVQILEGKLREQDQKAQTYRAQAAAEEGNASVEQLAEAKRRRDSARREVQRLNARLSALVAERRDVVKKLEKRAKQKASASSDPDMALPSVALRGGGDEQAVEVIRSLMRENKELEEAVAQHQGAKFHLEKLQNEKRDTLRRIKQLRREDSVVKDQLEIKRKELEELQSLIKPSAARARYEADVDRLRAWLGCQPASHLLAEPASQHTRLLRFTLL
jgi:chromosome segregation ATPase